MAWSLLVFFFEKESFFAGAVAELMALVTCFGFVLFLLSISGGCRISHELATRTIVLGLAASPD